MAKPPDTGLGEKRWVYEARLIRSGWYDRLPERMRAKNLAEAERIVRDRIGWSVHQTGG